MSSGRGKGSSNTNDETPLIKASLFAPDQNKIVLDLPSIPFDIDRHKRALTLGRCEVKELQQPEHHISIERMHARENQPGNGYGKSAFRQIVQQSMAANCAGKISTLVSTSYGSPHLFYLYMGMEPEDRKVSYLRYQYGRFGEQAIQALTALDHWSVENIQRLFNASDLKTIKFILSSELNIDIEHVTLETIKSNKDLLLNILEKYLDYTKEVFIPELLEILEEDPKNKFPDTRVLGAMSMHLTQDGFARWKHAVVNGLEFIPFKNLEHLPLNQQQKNQLQEIINKKMIRPE